MSQAIMIGLHDLIRTLEGAALVGVIIFLAGMIHGWRRYGR